MLVATNAVPAPLAARMRFKRRATTASATKQNNTPALPLVAFDPQHHLPGDNRRSAGKKYCFAHRLPWRRSPQGRRHVDSGQPRRGSPLVLLICRPVSPSTVPPGPSALCAHYETANRLRLSGNSGRQRRRRFRSFGAERVLRIVALEPDDHHLHLHFWHPVAAAA
jgi:hypothetical protein